ncbi:Urease alpha-subunit, N-terminal domain [Lentibacillus halodurans]|uniref:Urease alpha-subunit, N-terminal domain n=1 Tax=Lentibacillus halodurans TaxID=237679 RepID=A0A1I0XGE7_9BACI|nr:amidohydrolase family protein [Lentibacillus halodurans]SFA99767.1 Urease alpha-subunit, N-terminal domain [Lentibacillus halodurans]
MFKLRRISMMAVIFVLLIGTFLQTSVGNAAQTQDEPAYDTIIRNGTIIDGSGLPQYDADIGIRDGVIARIGNLENDTAEKEVDARGQFVTPGFIEIHSHASTSALQEARSSLTQGVTTEILNVDGGGPTDLQERFALEEEGLGINIGAHIGFNSVWEEVVGEEDRQATAEEINEMQELITKGMEDGAFGVSAGLFYRPAYYATTEEVIDVVSAADEWRTYFQHHIRNENNNVIDATAETIEIGEEAGLVPHITHMKVMGPDNWGKSEDTVGLIEEANARGTYATADVYPYLRSQTGLTAIVPPWVEDGGWDEMLERFADPELRPQIAEEIEDIMHSRVEGPGDVYFPTKRMTLADYMEQGFNYTRDGQALLGFLNFDYDSDITFDIDEINVRDLDGNTAFEYDFTESDEWESESFQQLFSYPSDAVNYLVEDNIGKVEIDERMQGNASAYGKTTPVMDELESNSEAYMRFKVSDVGNNQRIRFWLQADDFSSGSSFPVNGYGIELHLGNDELVLYGREDGSSTNYGSVDADMTTEWHSLRVRVEDDQLMVRLWNDVNEEPEEWSMTAEIPAPQDNEEEELTPGETTMRILETEGSLRSIYNFGHEDDFERILDNPTTAIASDGGATTSNSTHPRRYGTQPRALGMYIREEGLADWETMVQKMTGLPATIIGMTDRGFIAEGMTADITIFDPNTVIDNATFDQPKQYADGIEHVLVNGEFALENGELTGIQAGKALQRDANMPTRPMTTEAVDLENEGELYDIDEPNAVSGAGIDFSLQQGETDVQADGSFVVQDDRSGIDFEATGFGKIQVTDGWTSFTGRGLLNGDIERTFSVIIDKNETGITDDRPTVTIQIEGEDEIRGFLGDAEPSSIEAMKELVDRFTDEGEVENEDTARLLHTHLTTVGHYEESGNMDKAVKHMNSFKQLLDYQEAEGGISEEASNALITHADNLLEAWE